MKITTDEWLAELDRVTRESDDGLTVPELAVKFGHSTQWVRQNLLQPANAAGRLVLGRKQTTSIDGKPIRTPVYRLKKAKEKA